MSNYISGRLLDLMQFYDIRLYFSYICDGTAHTLTLNIVKEITPVHKYCQFNIKIEKYSLCGPPASTALSPTKSTRMGLAISSWVVRFSFLSVSCQTKLRRTTILKIPSSEDFKLETPYSLISV